MPKTKKKATKRAAKPKAAAPKKKARAKSKAAPARKKAATAKKATPKKRATPKKATPKKAAPKKTAPKKKATPNTKAAASGEATKHFAETLLRALTVAMIADGEIAPSEQLILLRFAREALFRGVDAEAVIESTINQCIDDGPETILDDVNRNLTSTKERETAFMSCLAVAATDGKVTPSEVRMLRALRDVLEIPNARAKSLAGPAAIIFE